MYKWNITQTDNPKDINIVMPMYDLIEYSYNYSKTTESWWQYYKDEPFLDANDNIADFPAESNNSGLCNFKTKIVGRTGNEGMKNVNIMVPLKYLSTFSRTREISLFVKLIFF